MWLAYFVCSRDERLDKMDRREENPPHLRSADRRRMAEKHRQLYGRATLPTPDDARMPGDVLDDADGGVSRRDMLGAVTTVAMFAGLAGGYGMFFALAGQFLFPARRGTAWMFVANAAKIPPGESISFASPAGLSVVIQRGAHASTSHGLDPGIDDFIALSSTCPHLGCRVHWESAQQRFFCPCHNGAFDHEGRPTAGPPLAANQHLPRYSLKLEQGLLFIELPVHGVDRTGEGPVG